MLFMAHLVDMELLNVEEDNGIVYRPYYNFHTFTRYCTVSPAHTFSSRMFKKIESQ